MFNLSKIIVGEGTLHIKDPEARAGVTAGRVFNTGKNVVIVGDNQTVYFNMDADFAAAGITVNRLYEAEAGFGIPGTNGHTFETLINTLDPEVVTDRITDVLFIGGEADRLFLTRVAAGIDAAVLKARETFKNAQIHIGFYPWTKLSYSYTTSLLNVLFEYEKSALRNNVYWIRNLDLIAHKCANNPSDEIGLTDAGAKEVIAALIQYINGRPCQNDFSQGYFSLENSDATSISGMVFSKIVSGTLQIYCAGITMNQNVTITNGFAQQVFLGTMTDEENIGYVYGNTGDNVRAQTFATIIIGTNRYVVPVEIAITDGAVYARISTDSDLDGQTFSNISIRSWSLCTDARYS